MDAVPPAASAAARAECGMAKLAKQGACGPFLLDASVHPDSAGPFPNKAPLHRLHLRHQIPARGRTKPTMPVMDVPILRGVSAGRGL